MHDISNSYQFLSFIFFDYANVKIGNSIIGTEIGTSINMLNFLRTFVVDAGEQLCLVDLEIEPNIEILESLFDHPSKWNTFTYTKTQNIKSAPLFAQNVSHEPSSHIVGIMCPLVNFFHNWAPTSSPYWVVRYIHAKIFNILQRGPVIPAINNRRFFR